MVFGERNLRNLTLLNSVFGYSLSYTHRCLASGSTLATKTAAAASTVFAAGPAGLQSHSCTTMTTTSSLPAGSTAVYDYLNTNALAIIPYGAGTIVLFGWDWYNAWPVGGFAGDGVGWIDVLDRAMLLP